MTTTLTLPMAALILAGAFFVSVLLESAIEAIRDALIQLRTAVGCPGNSVRGRMSSAQARLEKHRRSLHSVPLPH